MDFQNIHLDHEKYNSPPDISEVEPVGEHDRVCLEELRDVLSRHGKLDRFWVALLHKHFDLEAGEVLMEYVDSESRAQTVVPQLKPVIEDGERVMMTLFSLSQGEPLLGCHMGCIWGPNGHRIGHYRQGP